MKMGWTLLAPVLALPLVATAQEHRSEVRFEPNLVFASPGGVELKLDLAMPKEGQGPFPAVVCIHSGGLWSGTRQDLTQTILTLARHGYVAVTISYRLLPDARFPAQIADCKAAVRWLRANAQTYHVNPDHIGALGFSTGAYLACLLGTTEAKDGLEGDGGHREQSSRVQAVVSFFGSTDFTTRDWTEDVEKSTFIPYLGASFAERPDLYRKASPISYVTPDDPPFLFFHGTQDKIVNIRHSRLLAAKLAGAGVDARVVEVPGEGHGWKGDPLVQSITQMLDFLDKRLQK